MWSSVSSVIPSPSSGHGAAAAITACQALPAECLIRVVDLLSNRSMDRIFLH